MQEIFSSPSRELQQALLRLPEAIDRAFPMQPKHRRHLHLHIEELSLMLTSERGERGLMRQSYWSAPRLTAAYVWYFLPWNVVRLARLLHSLPLPVPEPRAIKKSGAPMPRIMADMGSGPLSFPLALWIAKPQWRALPLTILCTDNAIQPLHIGQSIFKHMAGEQCPWRIVPIRAALEQVPHEVYKTDGLPWLLSAANVCNELHSRGSYSQSSHEEQGLDNRLYMLMEKWAAVLHTAPTSNLLLVEPGTRLGGKTMVTLREAALECDLVPLSPCTHDALCPLEESGTWCHFTFDTGGSPSWLQDLSVSARLRKNALSLSFLLLQKRAAPEAEARVGSAAELSNGRIISGPLQVPSLAGRARYACYEGGLALVPNAEALPSGSLVRLREPEDERTDAKSGARIVDHAEKLAPRAESRVAQKSKDPAPASRMQEDTSRERKKKKPVKPSKKTQKKFWER